MNSSEIVNKSSTKNLTQEESATIFQEIFLGQVPK